MHRFAWLASLPRDIRHGIRVLLMDPMFTVVTVLTLGLGIGANTLMFCVVNGILLRPLPYPDPNRLMNVVSVSTTDHRMIESVSAADFPLVKDQTTAFDHSALYGRAILNLTGGQEPEQLTCAAITTDLFPLLGANPLLGRNFLPDEVARGKNQVAILGYPLWQRQFGGDRQIVGKSVVLSERLYTVIGVMPSGFAFPSPETALWVPLVLSGPEGSNHGWRTRRMLVRLKGGTKLAAAQAELNTVSARLARQFPQDQEWELKIVPLKEALVGRYRLGLLLLQGAVAFVLLIACANLASLFLSRGRAREREMAIRFALGATRGRVARQLLTENMFLALISACVALLFVYFGTRVFGTIAPAGIPRLDQIGVDRLVLWFVVGLSLLSGFLFGVIPTTRLSKPDKAAALKEGFQTDSTRLGFFKAHHTQSALVVAEIALAMVLTCGAGLLLRSLWKLGNVSLGFEPRNLLTMDLTVTSHKYVDPDAQIAYFSQIVGRVAALPGVSSVAFGSSFPLSPSMSVGFDSGAPSPQKESPQAFLEIVSPDYFRTLGMRLLGGRVFSGRETETSAAVVVVNQSFARRYFAGRDPLNTKIRIGWGKDLSGTEAQIVGIVNDLTPHDEPWPAMYVSYLQFQSTGHMNVLVRTVTKPLALADAVRRQIWSVDRNQPIVNLRTVEHEISTTMSEPRFNALLLGIFALLALTLASVGIFGVMSHSVHQRTHEIGIRMALGAARTDVLWLVLRQVMVVAGLGLCIGIGLSLYLTRMLRSLIFEVQPNDSLTFLMASLIVVSAALLAALRPACRASRADPMLALRYE
jgi:putative ABC transport system permease protein